MHGPVLDCLSMYPTDWRCLCRQSPLVAKISGLARDYLGSAGSGRTMAALLMGRLLTRPDQAGELSAFAEHALQSLQTQGVDASFIVPGQPCFTVIRPVTPR